MTFNLEKLKEVAKPRNEISKKRAEFRKENRALLRTLQDLILDSRKWSVG